MVKRGTLVDAVAAPRPGEAEHRHPAHEAAQKRTLLARQRESRVHRIPPRAVHAGCVPVEECRVR